MSPPIRLLPDIRAFWDHVNATQRRGTTPEGAASDAEERRDLHAGSAVKRVLEALIGPEEGDSPVQCQNWDWNDDATRPVYILSNSFHCEILPALQAVLAEEFADFRVLVLLQESWLSEIWGGIVVTANEIVVQQAVANRYGCAA